MTIVDTFAYDGPWDRVGLDCSNCSYFCGPEVWPDKNRVSACRLHGCSLKVELGVDDYKNREWFCKDFTHSSGARETALAHFNLIKDQLPTHILFGLWSDSKFLEEIPFESLPKT